MLFENQLFLENNSLETILRTYLNEANKLYHYSYIAHF
jgi:hypothetical protein